MGVPRTGLAAVLHFLVCLCVIHCAVGMGAAANNSADADDSGAVGTVAGMDTGDTWAVIVSSSRYWLNYRHSANALAVYQAVRRLGLPDSHILLMLADQPACSARNVLPGQLLLAPGAADGMAGGGRPAAGSSSNGRAGFGEAPGNLLAEDAEVDYRGMEVSVDSVLRVLTGRHPAGTSASKRLRAGPRSSVLLYLTGHGGDEFLKFHDQEELLASDIAAAVAQMHAAGRYSQLLLLADTCQASTLYSRISSPNVLGVASSKLGQSSYAHLIDTTIGLHLSDQFTFFLHHFLTTRLPPHPSVATSATTSSSTVPPAAGSQHPPSLQEVLDFIRGQSLASEVQVRTDLFPRRLADVAVTEFFGGGLMPAAPAAVRSPSQAAGSQPNKSEGGYGGGSVTGSSSTTVGGTAVQALLRAAVQAEQQAGAGARNAASRRQQEWHSWLPLQQSKHFEVLEAAGSGSQQLAKCGQQLASSAALLAVLWAVAVALSSWLLQGCEAI